MKALYMIQFFILAAVVAQGIFNTTWRRNHEESVVRQNISYALNASSDAATEFMLWESETTPFGNILIDPNVVWDIYIHTFLESIGLNSERNKKDIQSFFPLAMVVANDGYFLRLATQSMLPQQTVINTPNGSIVDQYPLYSIQLVDGLMSEQWNYRFTQKIPFARVTEHHTPVHHGFDGIFNDHIITQVNGVWGIPAGTVIADTLNGANIITYNSNPAVPDGNRFSRSFIDGTRAIPLRGGAHFPPYIARELLRAMDYAMTWNAPMTSQFRTAGGFSIPEEIVEDFTSESVTFIGPMVIAIMDGFDWIGSSEMSFWSISNTQIVDAPQVFVYNRPGVTGMVYSLCDPRLTNGGRPHMLDLGLGVQPNWPSGMGLIQIFTSQEAAAAMGAYPDLRVIQWCF
ncbi:MAG: hypothetical protein FWE27_04910 [Defluviitaleaceae bacterium]|nr:hypothetical protein [Defluviitaleaceae bacterium]